METLSVKNRRALALWTKQVTGNLYAIPGFADTF
jgi:hypothetical protein